MLFLKHTNQMQQGYFVEFLSPGEGYFREKSKSPTTKSTLGGFIQVTTKACQLCSY